MLIRVIRRYFALFYTKFGSFGIGSQLRLKIDPYCLRSPKNLAFRI